MFKTLPKTLFRAATLALLTACPAQAQNDLGIIGAVFHLGSSDHKQEGGYAGVSVDVKITDYHGLQLDLQYEERSTGGVGRLGGFLYMTPREGQKYGLSMMVADKNDVSATYGQFGAAGIFAIGERTNLALRVAVGVSADNDMDWVTAGAGLHWQAGDATRFYAHYDITEFDEESFGAIAQEVTFGLRTRLGDGPASLFAEASRDWLNGRDASTADTTLRAGVSFRLGRTGNNQPLFHLSDPMRQILRRGHF
ncbi:hypothetical protein OS190_06825 [Sulfitobacter sp. F26204]|uniref:hypothetical protein n=1 Tax=Sulfitobacter sp. F26204 TaxID=2996014 RepID=UPI00225E07F5|nr:hypothetical protein [Sulfitobacter sp. F26204]MCX7559278.1 hypothetical protein [Sulfitobacter sp. F26204]